MFVFSCFLHQMCKCLLLLSLAISILEAQNWKFLTNAVTQHPCSFRDPIHENAMENRGKGLRFVISVVNIYTYIHTSSHITDVPVDSFFRLALFKCVISAASLHPEARLNHGWVPCCRCLLPWSRGFPGSVRQNIEEHGW